MARRSACLQHIYNTGVNLAWAQVFTQEGKNATDVRAALVRAQQHARAAEFFNNPDGPIGLAIQRLDRFGVGQQALDAIESALFHLQGELSDYCCDVTC